MKQERMNPRASMLLRKAAGGFEPSLADKSKTRAAIARRVAVGVAAGSAIAAGAKTAAAAPSLAPAALAPAALAPAAMVTTTAASAPVVGGASIGAAAGIGFTTKLVATVAILGTLSAGAVTVRQVSKGQASNEQASKQTAEQNRVTVAVANHPVSEPLAVAKNAPAPAFVAAPLAIEATPITATPLTPSVEGTTPAKTSPIANAAENKANATHKAPALQTGAEVELLQRAQHALEADDATTALALLNEHATRFPNGALSEERDAARVLASCAAGRETEAAQLGAAFLNRYPESPLASRVRTSCAGAGAISGASTFAK